MAIPAGFNVYVASQDTAELASMPGFGADTIHEIYCWVDKVLQRYAPGMGDYNSIKFLVKNTGYLVNTKQDADLPFYSPQELADLVSGAIQYNTIETLEIPAGTGSFTLNYAPLEKGELEVNGVRGVDHNLGERYGNFEPTESQTPTDILKYRYNRAL